MDLVAGDAREILLAVGMEDWSGLRDERRFPAYISLGGGMDPIWLDLFSQAARETTGLDEPGPFSDAGIGDRTIERVDPHWIDGVATLPGGQVGPIAARWIELIDCEECSVDPEEKPMLRQLAGDLVEFCRRAEGAEDVLFAWSI
jgi:hypothetical protein